MGSIVHRSVPTNLKWFPNCSHAHALFQDRFKDVQVGSRWFSTLYILSPNFHMFCYQSWVSHVGYFHEGTASASARRLSITATGAMARCTLTSFLSTTTKGRKGPPRDQQQDNNRGDGGGQVIQLSLRYDRPVMGLPCWPLFFLGGLRVWWAIASWPPLFFGGGREIGTMRPVNN